MIRNRCLIAIISAAVSAFVVIIAFNLSPGESRLETLINSEYKVAEPAFDRSLSRLLGPPLLGGNKVTALHNGDEIFPAMIAAIEGAQRTITFEIYIYWKGEIGRQFTDLLCKKARAGVKVHVLLDWLGSDAIDQAYLDQMDAAGVEVERYRPLHWYNLDRMNNRSHRRLLVIDGKVGFTGGVGVADNWLGNAQDKEHWRDSHFRIEGPAVAEMQAAFMLNWMKMRPSLLHGDDYFPPLEPVGPAKAQVFASSAGLGDESIRLMYLLTIAAAAKSIRIANAYFVPDELAIKHLIAARQRGVDVEIILPGAKTDVPLTRRASRASWGKLLAAGIKIFEYQPTMYHVKVMIIDDLFVSVGSTNFDNRSFRLNDEANLNVIDAEFAKQVQTAFDLDKKQSQAVTLNTWQQRPWLEKLLEHSASLLETQL